MDFPFAAVEIVFQTNHPTVSKQKISRENSTFAHFRGFRQPPISERNPI